MSFRRLMLLPIAAVLGMSLVALPAVAQSSEETPAAYECGVAKSPNSTLSALLVKGYKVEIRCRNGSITASSPIAKVTGTLTVSSSAKRVLGLSSRVVAKGTLAGPPAGAQLQEYTLRFPSALRKKLIAKKVGSLELSPEFTVTNTEGVVATISEDNLAGTFNTAGPHDCKSASGLWYLCKMGALRP